MSPSTLTCGLGVAVVSCSKDDSTENSLNSNGSLKMTDPEGELIANGRIFEVENDDAIRTRY